MTNDCQEASVVVVASQLSGDFRFCTPDGNFQVVVFGAVALKIEV
jgi:hypothetical protein